MTCVRLRLLGAKAKVCLLALTALLLLSRSARAAPFELPERDGQPGVVVYPAAEPGARRVTVVLHGMCSEPLNACRHFAAVITQSEHLICPRASLRCDGGGSIWPPSEFAAQIERAVARGEAALAGRVDAALGRTLIGYSLGAFRALSLAEQGAGRYPRVMLIGARIQPSVRRLQAGGVERLLLGAGSWDMMHDHMRKESRRLVRAGVTATFLDLGPVGHALMPSFADYLPQALDWLNATASPGAA